MASSLPVCSSLRCSGYGPEPPTPFRTEQYYSIFECRSYRCRFYFVFGAGGGGGVTRVPCARLISATATMVGFGEKTWPFF